MALACRVEEPSTASQADIEEVAIIVPMIAQLANILPRNRPAYREPHASRPYDGRTCTSGKFLITARPTLRQPSRVFCVLVQVPKREPDH